MKATMLTVVPLALAAGVMAVRPNDKATNKQAGTAAPANDDTGAPPVSQEPLQYMKVTGGFFAESHPAFKKNRAEYENSCKKLLAAQHPTAVADYVSLGSGFTDETAGDVLVSCGALGADGKMTYHTKEVADQFKYILSPEIVTPPDSKETPKPKGKRSDELPAGVTDKLYDSKVGYQIWQITPPWAMSSVEKIVWGYRSECDRQAKQYAPAEPHGSVGVALEESKTDSEKAEGFCLVSYTSAQGKLTVRDYTLSVVTQLGWPITPARTSEAKPASRKSTAPITKPKNAAIPRA